MKRSIDTLTDETNVSDITILPDGRVYVFGMSRPIAEILAHLRPEDPHLANLLRHLRQLEQPSEKYIRASASGQESAPG